MNILVSSPSSLNTLLYTVPMNILISSPKHIVIYRTNEHSRKFP